MSDTHPRLSALIAEACARAAGSPPELAVVYPCDAAALQAAVLVASSGVARPVLVGPAARIHRIADAERIDISGFDIEDVADHAPAAAQRGVDLARAGDVRALMKGSLHTEELMAVVVARSGGLRGTSRITHAFVFDLPRYHKLLALADCVVNIAPDLRTKVDVISNAVELLSRIGIHAPKVSVLAAVEVPNPAIPATVDAIELARMGIEGRWPGAIVEGPFGFDNAFSADAARVKGIDSRVAGDADLMVVPDLNAGNMLYKSFNYAGGGECAGIVLGAAVPIVLTSRADSIRARVASAALAALACSPR